MSTSLGRERRGGVIGDGLEEALADSINYIFTVLVLGSLNRATAPTWPKPDSVFLGFCRKKPDLCSALNATRAKNPTSVPVSTERALLK